MARIFPLTASGIPDTVLVMDKQKPRGFAAMSEDRQRAIASKGGKSAHEKGTAHQFTVEEAKAAGAIGGSRVARDREHMRTIGSAGGKASKGRHKAGFVSNQVQSA